MAARAPSSYVAFVVGSVRYAVSIAHVKEVFRPLPVAPVPRTPSAVVGVAGGHLEHPTKKHAAGAGHGVVLFAARGHGVEHSLAHSRRPRRIRFLHLAEARCIDVQRLHGKQELACKKSCEVVVDTNCGLGETTRWFDPSMGAKSIAGRLHGPLGVCLQIPTHRGRKPTST